MKTIKLIEESKPCPVCSAGQKHTEPLNSPCGGLGRFFLANASERPIENGIYTQLKNSNEMWFWSAQDLEEFDMFYSPAGYRLTAKAIEMLKQAGYTVEIDSLETRKARRDAEIQRAEERKKAEEETKLKEQKAWQDKRAEMIPADFVQSGYIGHVLTAGYIKIGEVVRPDWKVAYYNHQALAFGEFEGERVIVEWFGNATIIWGTEAIILKLLKKEIEDTISTKTEAQKWLEKYRGCAGTEYMQLVAGETPTLKKFQRYDK